MTHVYYANDVSKRVIMIKMEIKSAIFLHIIFHNCNNKIFPYTNIQDDKRSNFRSFINKYKINLNAFLFDICLRKDKILRTSFIHGFGRKKFYCDNQSSHSPPGSYVFDALAK